MRLPDGIIDAVRVAGVQIYFADRRVTKIWNDKRDDGTPINYGGWYWNRTEKGRVVDTDEEGPFRSRSAAIRNAYMKLQLRWVKSSPAPASASRSNMPQPPPHQKNNAETLVLRRLDQKSK